MAARCPIRPAAAFWHAPQSNGKGKSLAGRNAYSHGPLVLGGQNVPNIACAGSH